MGEGTRLDWQVSEVGSGMWGQAGWTWFRSPSGKATRDGSGPFPTCMEEKIAAASGGTAEPQESEGTTREGAAVKKYRYVIVSSQGASLDIYAGPAKLPGLFEKMWYADEQYQALQDLMERGWRPVRETGMGGGSAVGGAVVAFSLVLLEKEAPPSELLVAQAADQEPLQEK